VAGNISPTKTCQAVLQVEKKVLLNPGIGVAFQLLLLISDLSESPEEHRRLTPSDDATMR
jgi:hypothetical protein